MKIVSKLLLMAAVIIGINGVNAYSMHAMRSAFVCAKIAGTQIVGRAKTLCQSKIAPRVAAGTALVSAGFTGLFKGKRTTEKTENSPRVTCLYAHGFADHPPSDDALKSTPLIGSYENPVKSFKFPESGTVRGEADFAEANFAQDGDIACVERAYANIEGDVVGIGFSRGGSALINHAARYKPTRLKGIIALSSPDSLQSIIQNKVKFGSLAWLGHQLAPFMFKKYDSSGVKAIDVVDQVPENVPMLFIGSDKDTIVPRWSIDELYKRSCSQGRKNSHLVILKNGGDHGHVSIDPRTQYVSHAWARHHKLPHIEELADNGQALFEQSQPDPAALNKYQPWGWWLDGAVVAGAAAVTAIVKSR